MQNIDFFKKMRAHFQSKSGSMYYYTDKVLYIYVDFEAQKANIKRSLGLDEETTPIIIQLKIDNSQKEYIRITLIFKKQLIEEEHEDYFILKMFVGNTIELRQRILKYGNRIEVISPQEIT